MNISWRKWSISGTAPNTHSSSFGPTTAISTFSVAGHPHLMGIGSLCRFGKPNRLWVPHSRAMFARVGKYEANKSSFDFVPYYSSSLANKELDVLRRQKKD
jgi:hypothetical protein